MLSRQLGNASDRSAVPKHPTCGQTLSLAQHEHHWRDLEAAQKQAVAAASIAFERANEQASAAQGLKKSDIEQAAGIDEQLVTRHPLGRKQSIRFTGPTAVQILRRSITQRVAPENNDISCISDGAQNESDIPGIYFGHGVVDARNSSLGEGNLQESHVSSASASLRKPKRAKSMFTLRGSATNSFGDNTPFKNSRAQQNLASSKNEHSQPSDKIESYLRRSFSFLRGEKDHMAPRLDMLKNHGVAAQLAREQCLQELEENFLKESSSSPTPCHNHKPQKAFRRSVRSKRTNSCRDAIAPPVQAPTKFSLTKRLRHKATSLSSSFQQTLKHVFQRPSGANDTIPVQQLHASRLHFGENSSQYSGASQEGHQILLPESEILRKATSHEPSLGKEPDFFKGGSPTGSLRNIQDEDETTHLFQGWASPVSGQSREMKRLSVIQEHGGPHHLSSSDHEYADIGNVLLAPLKNNLASQHIENSPNNQKIHSILPQNIDENQPLAQSREYFREKEDVDYGVAASPSKPRGASQSTHSLDNKLMEALSPHQGVETSNLVIIKPWRTGSINDEIHQTQHRSGDYSIQDNFFETYTSLIKPEQNVVQNRTNGTYPKQPLREVKTAFFPSSMHIERTNLKPYRRVVSPDCDNENGADSELEENTRIRAESESAFRSASIYSRTSGGNTPKENQSSASLAQSETSHGHCRSVVIETLHSSPVESFALPRNWREFSSQSENCQNEMKPKIFGLGDRRLGETQDLGAAGGDGCHKRESAQIVDGNSDVTRSKDDADMKQQVFGIPSKHATPQPGLRHHALGSLFRRSPLLEIGQSATPGRSELSSNSSPRQPSTPHRSLYLDLETSSLETNNLGSEELGPIGPDANTESEGRNPLGVRDGCMLRHGISASSESIRIDMLQDMRETRKPAPLRAVFRRAHAAKSQGFNRPEQPARVRRLQSSNSVASHNKVQIKSNTEDNVHGQNDKEVIDPTFEDLLRIGSVLNRNVSSTSCKEAQLSRVHRVKSFSSSRKNQEVSEDNGTGSAFL